MEEENFLVWTV